MNAIVIGSGLGGMSTAIRLAAHGFSVEVFEANATYGGKLYQFENEGFRFDGGPSLFTMPHLVDELFSLAPDHHTSAFQYRKLEESCRYFWEDGQRMTGFSDPIHFAQEVERVFHLPQLVVLDYFRHIKNIYDSSGKIFLEKSLHKAPTWLSRSALNSFLKLGQFDLFATMNSANEKRD